MRKGDAKRRWLSSGELTVAAFLEKARARVANGGFDTVSVRKAISEVPYFRFTPSETHMFPFVILRTLFAPWQVCTFVAPLVQAYPQVENAMAPVVEHPDADEAPPRSLSNVTCRKCNAVRYLCARVAMPRSTANARRTAPGASRP